MNVFALNYESPMSGERMMHGVYSDVSSALLSLSKLIEGLREHVTQFYFIQEWEVGNSKPSRHYKIAMVDGTLVASLTAG